jgi:hypothetical protein
MFPLQQTRAAQSVMPRGFPTDGRTPGILQSYPELALGTIFDGVNDIAEVTGLGLGAPAEFTAMGWFSVTALPSFQCLIDTEASTTTNGYGLFTAGTGILCISAGPAAFTPPTFSVGLVTNRRYHVALVVSAGVGTLYLNGGLAGSFAITVPQRPTSFGRIRFGTGVSGGDLIAGRLSAWSVYSRALSEAEIGQAARTRAIYPSLDGVVAIYPFDQLAPTATQSPDISGNARHLTLTNMPANPIVAF